MWYKVSNSAKNNYLWRANHKVMRKEIRFVSAEEAVKVVKSGDHIHLSSVASAPRILIDALCARG